MNSEKYIGLDLHQATISVAVLDSTGTLVMESILETKAATILEFFAGWRGTLSVTFEEGTWAAWLYDLLKPHVAKLVVCNPRKNALLKDGNKSGLFGWFWHHQSLLGSREPTLSWNQLHQLRLPATPSGGNECARLR